MKPARNTQGWSMNPITLFILILLTSFLVFLVNQTMYYVLLGMSFLFLVLFSYSEGIKRAVVYIGLFLLIKLLAYIDLGMTTGALIGLIALFLRLYPIFNIGRILILTSPLKIMSALRAVKAHIFVIRIFPFGIEYICDFVFYVCYIEVDAISEIFIDTVVVEDIQVKSGILHISGILRRRIHPDHALNREVKQHIVCTFFVKRQFEADHVVQECSFKTQFIVGHGRPFQV